MLRRMTPRVAAPAVAAPRRFCATKAVATETAEATGCCTPANSYEAFKYGVAAIVVFFLLADGSWVRWALGLDAQTPPACAGKPKVDGVVFSGPSGVGKGTVIKRLMDESPGRYDFCVSHTTRAPRKGEVDGKHYHFTTREKMQEMVAAGDFLESCDVHGNMYGTSKAALKAVHDSGKLPIIEIDYKGVQKLQRAEAAKDLKLFYVFIQAPSLEELERRIVGRGQEGPDKVARRLQTARAEMAFIASHPETYNKIVTNADLDASVDRVQRLLQLHCGVPCPQQRFA